VPHARLTPAPTSKAAAEPERPESLEEPNVALDDLLERD